MKLIRLQVTFFTPNVVYGNFQSVLKDLLVRCGEILDGNPISLPVPANAPEEMPRVVLRSSSNDRELAVKPQRIDTAFARPYEDGIPDHERDAFAQLALTWVLPFLDERKVGVNRIGVVMQRAFTPDGSSPAEFIAKRYCRDEFQRQPLGNAKNFELHCLKNYKYKDLAINSWVRLQTINVQPSNETVVGVLNDLNHIPLDRNLTSDEMTSFVVDANKEALGILGHYKL